MTEASSYFMRIFQALGGAAGAIFHLGIAAFAIQKFHLDPLITLAGVYIAYAAIKEALHD